MVLSLEKIFEDRDRLYAEEDFNVTCSYLEVYNEVRLCVCVCGAQVVVVVVGRVAAGWWVTYNPVELCDDSEQAHTLHPEPYALDPGVVQMIYDLLVKSSGPLELREDPEQGICVSGLKQVIVGGADDIMVGAWAFGNWGLC